MIFTISHLAEPRQTRCLFLHSLIVRPYLLVWRTAFCFTVSVSDLFSWATQRKKNLDPKIVLYRVMPENNHFWFHGSLKDHFLMSLKRIWGSLGATCSQFYFAESHHSPSITRTWIKKLLWTKWQNSPIDCFAINNSNSNGKYGSFVGYGSSWNTAFSKKYLRTIIFLCVGFRPDRTDVLCMF